MEKDKENYMQFIKLSQVSKFVTGSASKFRESINHVDFIQRLHRVIKSECEKYKKTL